MSKDILNFINGEYVKNASGRTYEKRNPVDNSLIGTVWEAGKREVDAAVAAAKADGRAVQPLQPGVAVAVGEEEEEPLHLHAAAVGEKLGQAPWAEVGQPFHQLVGLVEALAVWQLIEQFEVGAFERR